MTFSGSQGWGTRLAGLTSAKNGIQAIGDQWIAMDNVAVIATVDYAVYVEYGTSRMSADGSMRDAVRAVNVQQLANSTGSADELGQAIANDIQQNWASSVPVDTGAYRASIQVVGR